MPETSVSLDAAPAAGTRESSGAADESTTILLAPGIDASAERADGISAAAPDLAAGGAPSGSPAVGETPSPDAKNAEAVPTEDREARPATVSDGAGTEAARSTDSDGVAPATTDDPHDASVPTSSEAAAAKDESGADSPASPATDADVGTVTFDRHAPIEVPLDGPEQSIQLADAWEFVGWSAAEPSKEVDRSIELDGAEPAQAETVGVWDYLEWQKQAEANASRAADASGSSQTASADAVTLDEVKRNMASAPNASVATGAALSFLTRHFVRAFVLVERFGEATVWRTAGEGDSEPAVSSLRVDLNARSVLTDCLQHAAAVTHGRPGEDEAIFRALAPGGHAVVAPISVRGQAIAFLWADAGDGAADPSLVELVADVAAGLGAAYEQFEARRSRP